MKTKLRLLLFFVFSLFFLFNCFSLSVVIRYYPKKLVVYPLAKYSEFYYFINITYKNISKKICLNTSSFKNYKPYIFGEASNIYLPNTVPNITLLRIYSRYFKGNKTCKISLEYKYLPNATYSGLKVYISPMVLNPYPNIFDLSITNTSKLFYKLDKFIICFPKIYELESVKFLEYKIFFAFNKSNYPTSTIVLNITKFGNTSKESRGFKRISMKGGNNCYEVNTPYISPNPRKIGTIKIDNLTYDLYSSRVYGIYEFTVKKTLNTVSIKKSNPKTSKSSKKNVKKIYILILIILVIVILGLLYYYIRKERGEW